MARALKESLDLIRNSLKEIKTSLADKRVVTDTLKVNEVPARIREIEIGLALSVIPKYNDTELKAKPSTGDEETITATVKDGKVNFKKEEFTKPEYWIYDESDNIIGRIDNSGEEPRGYTWTELKDEEIYKDLGTSLPDAIIFTDQKAPANIKTIDCSKNGDGSIVKWAIEDEYYVSTQVKGIKIEYVKKHVPDRFKNVTSLICSYNLDLTNLDTSQCESLASMFDGCKAYSLDLRGFDTRNVTNMSRMFSYCSRLDNLDLNNFDTSKVTDFSYMFAENRSLKTINLKGFNTSQGEKFDCMFMSNEFLQELDLSDFNFDAAINMTEMFFNCNRLKDLKLPCSQYSQLSSTMGTFDSCKSLTSIDLHDFTGDKLFDARDMFDKCDSLETIDLSSCYPKKIATGGMNYMFSGCPKLKYIYAKDWTTIENAKYSSNVFEDDISLSGYGPEKIHGGYAKPISEGGYFTDPR